MRHLDGWGLLRRLRFIVERTDREKMARYDPSHSDGPLAAVNILKGLWQCIRTST